MKIFSKIFIILIFSYLMAKCLIKEEINCGLKDTIDIRHHLIDSLYKHCQELQYRYFRIRISICGQLGEHLCRVHILFS